MERVCNVADGAAGIEAALAAALAGDVVTLEPGRYALQGPLTVPSGVTLQGVGWETVLEHRHDGPAVQVRSAQGVRLQNFAVETAVPQVRRRVVPDDPPTDMATDDLAHEWGLIWIDECSGCAVANLRLAGNGVEDFDGLCTRRSSQILVRDCTITGFFGRGLSFLSITDGVILGNDISRSYFGIMLAISSGWGRACSARITGNRCHENTRSGIVLFSSESKEISGNDCWGNEGSGITLIRDSDAPDQPSRAVITGNLCHENTAAGIALFSSESDEIAGNDCWGNASGGITLQRNQNALDQPSRAVITGNRCHENTQSGILLSSSESDEIAGNDCWGNASGGILLQRDPKALDQPSRATITGNRCHENRNSGIVLSSSESEVITGNDCWGNGRSGISLERSQKAPDQPSRAFITGNQCHENAQSGIELFSSESAGIAGNDCWGNGGDGIFMTRDQKALDQSFWVAIAGNRCHQNGAMGLSLTSSLARITGNEVWGNASAGLRCGPENMTAPPCNVEVENNCFQHNRWSICLELKTDCKAGGNAISGNSFPASWMNPAGNILGDIDWNPIDLSESRGETEARMRRHLPWGALAGQLQAEGVERPDLLARFCHGGGAMGDLQDWLGLPGAVDVAEGASQGEPKPAYRFTGTEVEPDGDRLLHFAPNGYSGLSSTFWQAVSRHVRDQAPGVWVIGACGDFGAEVDHLLDEAERLNRYDADRHAVDNPAPSGSLDLARAFGLGGHRFGRAVVQDMSARNDLAFAQRNPDLGLLEPAAVHGMEGWMARLGFVLRNPAVLAWPFVFLLCAVAVALAWAAWKDFQDPLGDPMGAIWFALLTAIDDFKVIDLWGMLPLALGGGIGVLGLMLSAINRQLPRHLAVPTPVWLATLARKLRREAEIADIVGSTAPIDLPWQRWMRMRLFRQSGDLTLVVLRNCQEWTEGDLAAFAKMLDLRPAKRSLIVVIETPTRGIVDRAVLRPVLGEGAKLPPSTELEICLGQEPGPLDLARGAATEPLAELLGVPEAEVDRHRNEIRANAFDLPDLIPLQTIGSNPHLPFCITRPGGSRYELYGPHLERQFLRVGQIHSADPDFKLDLSKDAVALKDWLAHANRSSATVVVQRTGGHSSWIDVLGRFQKRQAMAHALQAVFAEQDEALRLDYLYTALACAERHAFDRLRSACSGEPPRLAEALTSLRSAIFARGERLAIPHTMNQVQQDRRRIQSEMIAADAKAALGALEAIRTAPGSPHQTMLARLEALSVMLAPDPLQALSDLLAGKDRSHLKTLVDGALRAFDDTDRELARMRVTYRLRPVIAPLPAALKTHVRDLVDRQAKRGRSLAQLISMA